MSTHHHQQHENESMWISSRFQNRGSSSDKLVVRIDCVPTRSEQAANWCREPDVEKWGNWCRQLTRRFGPEIWKKRPYVVSPLNSIEWIRLHWFCNAIKNYFHSLIHIKRNCYKKLANCLRTNGMKGRNGERKIHRLEEEIGKNGRWRRAEGEIEYDSSKRQKENAKNSVRRYEKKVKGQTKNVLAHRLN